MSFWDAERSAASGLPVELHEFHLAGTETYWRYADAPVDVFFDEEWFPALVCHGGPIELGTNALKNQMEVSLDPECDLVIACLPAAPERPIEYKRFKLQGSFFIRSFSGQVLAIKIMQSDRQSAPVAKLIIDPGYHALTVGSLLPRYGRRCGVPLYSAACGVDPGDHDIEGEVGSVEGVTITSNDLVTDPDGQLAQGKFSARGCQRKILTHSGATIVLAGPIPGLAVEDPFLAWPGCLHTPESCAEPFGNLDNYRGHPNMPATDPYGGDAICY